MEIRITYRSEIYIKGDSLDEIRHKWENVNLDPNISQDDSVTDYSFIEIDSVEDADSYKDLMSEF